MHENKQTTCIKILLIPNDHLETKPRMKVGWKLFRTKLHKLKVVGMLVKIEALSSPVR